MNQKREINNNVVNLSPTLFEAGRVKIGMKGEKRQSQGGGTWQAPVKLDHFVITKNNRDATGNFVRDEELMARLTKDADGKIRKIPIVLLYDDINLNFISSYTCYMGTSLMCRGDGHNANEAVIQQGKLVGWAGRDCTCPRSEFGYEGKDKCKLTGRLQFVVRGNERLGGVHTIRTTSVHSVRAIQSALLLFKSMTGGTLAGIPLELSVNPRQVNDPTGKAQTVYVLGLEFVGDMNRLRNETHERLLDNAKFGISIKDVEREAIRMLSSSEDSRVPFGQNLSEDDQQEYFPDEVADAELVDPANAQSSPVSGSNQAGSSASDAEVSVAKSAPALPTAQAPAPAAAEVVPPAAAEPTKPTTRAARKPAETKAQAQAPAAPAAPATPAQAPAAPSAPAQAPAATNAPAEPAQEPAAPTVQANDWDFE